MAELVAPDDEPTALLSFTALTPTATPLQILVSPEEGGGAAVPGTVYLDNGRLKASLDGTPIVGGRLVAIET